MRTHGNHRTANISLAEETMLQVDFQRGREFFFMALAVCVLILAVEHTVVFVVVEYEFVIYFVAARLNRWPFKD